MDETGIRRHNREPLFVIWTWEDFAHLVAIIASMVKGEALSGEQLEALRISLKTSTDAVRTALEKDQAP